MYGDEFEGIFDEFDEFGVLSLCVCEKGGAFDEFGVCLMSLGVGLEQELGDEFGVEFDEFDEFGVRFLCAC